MDVHDLLDPSTVNKKLQIEKNDFLAVSIHLIKIGKFKFTAQTSNAMQLNSINTKFSQPIKAKTMDVSNQQKHFVLVHGASHGAWCWFKLKPLLESAGHKVTAMDLTASGINLTKPEDVRSHYDMTLPLLQYLAALALDDKVVLVGHSLGGINIALAMENYPKKIAVGVFLNALMPDTTHAPSYPMEMNFKLHPDSNYYKDTVEQPYVSPEGPEILQHFGTQFLAENIYQASPVEDLDLGKYLLRPSPMFQNELTRNPPYTQGAYGSVKRVMVTSSGDLGILPLFQTWQKKNFPPDEEFEIDGGDHMIMISKPQELSQILQTIANTYA